MKFNSTAVAALIACLAAPASWAQSPSTHIPSTRSASAQSPLIPSRVQWIEASTPSDVTRAFSLASAQQKPVFLYWGAVWCPPCNQVKATLFNRADFAKLAQSYVMVRVDGDKPGAQQVAQQYRVRGYPSMLVLDAKGTEITRLPGEVDPERYLATMQAALTSALPVKDMVKRASNNLPLTDAQWSLLAFYSWDTDEAQAGGKQLTQTLATLAKHAPAGAVRDRLQLRAAAAQSTEPIDPARQANTRELVTDLLASPARADALADIWASYASTLVKYMQPEAGPERDKIVASLDSTMERALTSGKHSRSEQLDLWIARVALGEWSTADAGLKKRAIHAGQHIAASSTDRYERQAVVPSAAHLLAQSDDPSGADAMLQAELPKAVAPYYHMLLLASNAKKRKDPIAALNWYERAWTQSQGSATKAQWGQSYVSNLIDLSPADLPRIEKAAQEVLTQATAPQHFYARTQRSVARMASKFQIWTNGEPSRAAVAQRLNATKSAQCKAMATASDARNTCDALNFAGI